MGWISERLSDHLTYLNQPLFLKNKQTKKEKKSKEDTATRCYTMRNINSGKMKPHCLQLFYIVVPERDICNNFTEDEMRRRDKVYIRHFFVYLYQRAVKLVNFNITTLILKC